MVGIHVFNMGGYSILFDFLIRHSSVQMIQQLDDHQYEESELIELKIHLPLPYNANWPEYERIDGEIEFNGLAYNYVKRKVWKDTLYLLCIPNTGKMEMSGAKTAYAQKAADTPGDQNRSPFAKKDNINATCNEQGRLINPAFANTDPGLLFSSFDSPIISAFLEGPDQPPEIG